MQRWQKGAVWMGSAAVAAALIAPLGGVAAKAQEDSGKAAVLFTDSFETGVGDWTTFGGTGKVSQTTEAAQVKSGKGTLAFQYPVTDKKSADATTLPFSVLVRPTPDGALAKMRSLRFWLHTDHDTPIVLALSEQGGGRYIAVFWSPKGVWQQIALKPSDFHLSDDKNDPKDPDGKLDLDQVENVSLISLWSLFAQEMANNPMMASILAKHLGDHTLLLDDFSVGTDSVASVPPPPNDPKDGTAIWIDTLGRETLSWLVLGDSTLTLDKTDAPFKTRALRLDYTQTAGAFVALIHDLHRADLSKADRLTFDVASKKPAKMLLSLEEKSGAKYNAMIEISGDSTAAHKSVAFSDFKLADDSPKDDDGKLDLDQLKSLTILDASGLLGQDKLDKQPNTLWLGPLHADTPAK